MILYNKKDIPEHLQKYFEPAELGLEKTPEEYIAKMVEIFREVRRVLRDDGTLWLNLGDSYWSDTLSRKDPVESMWGNRPASDLSGGRNNIPKQNTRGGLGKRPNGLKPKDLCGIPWRVALALQSDGWYLRSDIIWNKPNPMPESVTDRPTKAHEYIFLMTKSAKYYYDADAIKEESAYPMGPNSPESIKSPYGQGFTRNAKHNFKRVGSKRGESICPNSPMPTHREDRKDNDYDTRFRNKRTVWSVATVPYKEAHFATFPPKLIEPCILAGCPEGGTVIDPFIGSGTTAIVAHQYNRKFIGIDLSEEYLKTITVPRIERETKQRKLF